jgi:hypothetical protein
LPENHQTDILQMRLAGANRQAQVSGEADCKGKPITSPAMTRAIGALMFRLLEGQICECL